MSFLMTRFPAICRTRCLQTIVLRPYTNMHDLYSGRKKSIEKKEAIERERKIDYLTHKSHTAEPRPNQTLNAETGIKPTNLQQFFLVITRLYTSRNEIPEYVSINTLCRMGDRMRIVYITGGVIFCFVIFYSFESQLYKKILRDRQTLAYERHKE